MASTQNVGWTSRWTFILAATGSAVGLGNIWKFPYITGENGGGAFVILYLGCLLLLGVPIMIAEVMLGRKGQANPIKAMQNNNRAVNAHKGWTVIGMMGVSAGLLILMYYSVVAGWSLQYVYESFAGQHVGMTSESVGANFSSLTGAFGTQLALHSAFMVLVAGVVVGGVTNGIGKAVEYLMPALFIMLIVLLGYSFSQGDFAAGFNFLLSVDFSKVTGNSVLIALGQAFFTLSLGMGSIMAYGAYMPKDASIPKTVVMIALLDSAVALIAGLAIFPIVFANGMEPASGPGLMFITLPVAFGNIWGGAVFGGIFFLLVAVAALSSAISLLEPGIAWLEQSGLSRRNATLILGFLCWAGGIGSIYSSEIFDMLDNITSKRLSWPSYSRFFNALKTESLSTTVPALWAKKLRKENKLEDSSISFPR